MSQFLNEAESLDGGDEELKRSLKSLRPRSTVDPKALLAEVTSRTEGDVAVAPSVSAPRERRRAGSMWWPALTALSWLVTAAVWWSSMNGAATNEPANGITVAASDNGAMTDDAANDSANDSANAGQLGESIAASGPAVSDNAAINASDHSDTSQSSPLWLAWLGLEFAAFDSEAGERRWEQIQQQSEAPNWPIASGVSSGDHASATYASLRSEFDTPIRTNWLSQ